jgi:ubiquinone/menaquinone biosynthesis C-methylase UbiE
MKNQVNVADCYNKTAKNYAEKFIDELKNKPLDRILLQAFAKENSGNGRTIDLGCGPGQTTRFLYNCGLTNIIGVDIALEMVKVAKKLFPAITFETGDMLNLKYPEQSFNSAIAFYSIVNFDHDKVKTALKEIHRILKQQGQFLFSFHVGDQVIHLDELLGHSVNIDFYCFEIRTILELLTETGFEIIDAIERQPYPQIEYPSVRAYVWVKKL